MSNPVSILSGFEGARVLCVGDLMMDRFVDGSVERISPESPVPVFNATHGVEVPGGAANVARNVRAMGGLGTVIGVVGDDVSGRALGAELEAAGIRTCLVVDGERPTTEKTRYVVRGQHLFRVDTEVTTAIDAATAARVLESYSHVLPDHDVVVLSDYAKGCLSAALTRDLLALARAQGKPTVVDPKGRDFAKYAGAMVVTPNTRELEAVTNRRLASDDEVVAAAREVRTASGIQAVLVTRAERGMTVVSQEGRPAHIPSVGREVFDVVGAGDTVVAALALSIAAGEELMSAAQIANAAAGVVVGKRGTATVSLDELYLELEHRGIAGGGPSATLSTDAARRFAVAAHVRGQRVGFTNGVFDILHPGHIHVLAAAKAQCDVLFVGLNSDASVKRLKGPQRPINSEGDRAAVLGALEAVDAVVIFDEDTPINLIKAVRPDVLVKGGDYELAAVVGADFVTSYGGEVLLTDLVSGRSSTSIIAKARS